MREIDNFENYLIDEQGNIFSKKSNKFISKRKSNKGYYIVDLFKNNKRNQLLVHRLVAQTFIPNLNKLPCVNHKDENKLNNDVNNLEWCSQKYNMNYGSCPKRIGEKNSKRIVAIDKYGNKIEFKSSMEAYRKLNISSGNIYDCLYHKRNRKTAGGYIWEFVK